MANNGKRPQKTSKNSKKTIRIESETIYRKDENGDYQPLPAQVIDESWEESVDINFDKIWLATVMDALEQVGNKKMKVVTYLLNNRDKNTNFIIKNQREIAEECGVSKQTVTSTIRALMDADMIIGKSGVYQINPDKLARGSHNKRMAILRIYRQTKNSMQKHPEEFEE